MIVDALLAVSGSITGNTLTGQNVFATNANVTSTNTVDLLQNRDIGEGQDLYGRVEVTTAAAGGTSIEFQYIVADDAALSTNVTVIGTTGAIAVASLVAGARFACKLNPRLGSLGQRYLGMRAVNIGANSAGAVYADVGAEIADLKVYASGFAVL
jgi:hypothetical protein